MTKNKKYVQAAQRRLVSHGLPEAVLDKCLSMQIVLLDGKIAYETKSDEVRKGMILPYWQAEPLLVGTKEIVDEFPFSQYVLRGYRLRQSQARLDQHFALLRCIEALRMHAAENGGKLPARLEDIKLPLPVDPVTGQPFQYRLDAGIAHLRGTLIPGLEKSPHYDVRYEITIRK